MTDTNSHGIEWDSVPRPDGGERDIYGWIENGACLWSIRRYRGKWVVFEDAHGNTPISRCKIIGTYPTLEAAKVGYMVGVAALNPATL